MDASHYTWPVVPQKCIALNFMHFFIITSLYSEFFMPSITEQKLNRKL